MRGFAGGDGLRHGFAGNWAGLEAPGAPAHIHEEITKLRGRPHDGRIVGSHVAHARPLTQDFDAVQLRKQLQRIGRHLFQRGQSRPRAIGLVGIDLSADHQLPLRRLAHVDMQARGHNHVVEKRLDQLRHTCLERLADDGQGNAGHVGNCGRPAGGSVEHSTRR